MSQFEVDPILEEVAEMLPPDVDIVAIPVVLPPTAADNAEAAAIREERASLAEHEVARVVRELWTSLIGGADESVIDMLWTDGVVDGQTRFVVQASMAAELRHESADSVVAGLVERGWDAEIVERSVLARTDELFVEVQFRDTEGIVAMRVRSSPLALGDVGSGRVAAGSHSE